MVTVAPRGFGPSARPGSYAGEGFARDIERVLNHLDVESYAAFGYSMSGVMAAQLAVGDPRVTAVACGGFPLTADLSRMGHRVRARNAEARRDPDTWTEVVAAFDPDAEVAFWDAVGRLPRASLAELPCPVRAWWGELDDNLASLMSPHELQRDLNARHVAYDVVPALDHDGMLHRLGLVLPSIASCLEIDSARSAAQPRECSPGGHPRTSGRPSNRGSPARIQPSTPSITSVASTPNRRRSAAANDELYPCRQITMTDGLARASGMQCSLVGSNRHSSTVRSMTTTPGRSP
ncbi:MAG: Alpha/beta hydrolase fold [Nocardioides sp.]|nr:Alpha/beta hydrolase fold [Nocardioides sp.]